VNGFFQVLGTNDNGANEAWTLANQTGSTPSAAVHPNSDNLLPANANGDIIALNVPEPASLGILGIGMGLVTVSRRMRRKTA